MGRIYEERRRRRAPARHGLRSHQCPGGSPRRSRQAPRRGRAEGDAISAGSEFAAVQFIAGATGESADTVAHVAITTIAAVPDVLAVLLLVAAGYAANTHGVAREGAERPRNQVGLKSKPARKASRRRRSTPKLKVLKNATA